MREMSAGSEYSYDKLNPYGFIKYQVPMQQMGPHQRIRDLVNLNCAHGELVRMVVKPSGQVMHMNHLCGPELLV